MIQLVFPCRKRVIFSFFFLLVLAGCSGRYYTPQEQTVAREVPLVTTKAPTSSNEPLDVRITLLDAGNPAGEIAVDQKNIKSYQKVRSLERYFISNHLKYTLQQSQLWGDVRVDPVDTEGAELTVSGKIVHSDGQYLALAIQAKDATGRVWYTTTYRTEVSLEDYDDSHAAGSYGAEEQENPGGKHLEKEPFQKVYNQVANDLGVYLSSLSAHEINKIKTAAELRYAAYLAPKAFSDYLEGEGDSYQVKRLPAKNDPLLIAINRIRARDALFLGVVNQRYDGLYQDLQIPYKDWRRTRYDEIERYNQATSSAVWKSLGGAALIVTSLLLSEKMPDNLAGDLLPALGVFGGAKYFMEGIEDYSSAKIHLEAISELDESFQMDSTTLRLEVEGKVLSLTGDLKEKYQQWQGILQTMYHDAVEPEGAME